MSAPENPLRPSVLRVFVLALEARSNAQIAATLGISPNTVKVHLAEAKQQLAPEADGSTLRWLVPVARRLGRIEGARQGCCHTHARSGS